MYRKIALSFLIILFLPVFVLAAPDDVARVTGRPEMQTTVPTGRIVMRLTPDSGLRGGADGLALERGAKAASTAAAERLTGLVADLAAGAELESRFPSFIGDKAASGQSGPDMGLYVHFDARTLDRDVLVKMAARLNADPAVDMAYLEPVAVPAALGFDAVTGSLDLPALPSASFDSLQGYMEDAPEGIGALSMRGQAGALGAGLSVIDVEGAWLWSHEDLPAPMADIGDHIDNPGWRYHGTAVVGVIRGEDNAYGVTGITPACAVGSSSVGSQSVAQAILSAAGVLSPGDAIVIELHAPGPEATGVGQEGYVPMEFWQDIFDAIQVVTAQGLIVCEAAGNGAVDLDAALYAGMFDRALRDSGAIMIGATNGQTLGPAWFSNNGVRVDLNGWGFDVTTLAYGDLQGDPDFPEEQWYTAQFSGTSSATPVVTGAVVGLQGMVRAQYGMDLDARLARDILLATGTPTSGPQLIGSRPDMVAAWALADSAIGAVGGTVTDQLSGLPIEDVLVQVTGGGSWTRTAADGTWYLPLLTGPVDFDFTLFGYQDAQGGTVITMGTVGTLDMTMDAEPLVDITGTVYGGSLPLSGALVTPMVQPVSPTSSGGAGDYTLPVPSGTDYLLRFDGVPGYGARVVEAPVMQGDHHLSPGLDAIEEDFEADDGGFTSTTDSLWTHGVPPAAVVGSAFSGANCWGIGMDGSGYEDAQTDTLTSTFYNLVPLAGKDYYQLSFHFWSETENGFDGVQVLASSNTFDWEVLTPVEGYTDNFLGGLGQQPGWSGHSGRWQGTVFDITAYTGGLFQFKLVFGSDGGVTDAGFFIDGIAFGEGKNATAVPDGPVPVAKVASLTAWPNPFNPRVNIAWKMPSTGHLQVAVFDLRGRRVRVLQDDVVGVREGVLTWDGRDSGGRTAASGVYLVQMRGAGGAVASQRVVLAK